MKSTACVFLYLVFALTIRAEIMMASSLEWLADTAASIATYRVAEVRKESDWVFQLSFELDGVLKGTPPQTAASPYWVDFRKKENPSSIARGDRFLIFLKLDRENSARVVHLINLSNSRSGTEQSAAINCKFQVLTDPTQILATVQGRLSSHPMAIPKRLADPWDSRVSIPSDSPAYEMLYRGSACYLLVPDDLKPAKPEK